MIIIISGTNRENSLTYTISRYYQELIRQRKVTSQILDLSGLPADFTKTALYENNGRNELFNRFQEVIDASQKFVFIVPEYNGSFPGVLKTFIDGLRYPDSMNNKKAALVGLSAGVQGGALALSHLNDILNYLGTDVLSLRVKLHQVKENMKDNRISNPLYNELLGQQIDKFIAF